MSNNNMHYSVPTWNSIYKLFRYKGANVYCWFIGLLHLNILGISDYHMPV